MTTYDLTTPAGRAMDAIARERAEWHADGYDWTTCAICRTHADCRPGGMTHAPRDFYYVTTVGSSRLLVTAAHVECARDAQPLTLGL